DRAFEMESEGADIIEIGSESTRPGATVIPAEEELSRLLPALKRVSGRLRVPISVDTYKSDVARVALELGASIINDVSALRFDEGLADVVARSNGVLVLMHMRETPATMQKIPPSRDIFGEIDSDLRDAIAIAEKHGVMRDRI